MTDEEFQQFIHPIFHDAMAKNDKLQAEFSLGTYQSWYYDQPTRKLTFLNDGQVIVEADFQVVGTFHSSSETWMWSWQNQSIEDAAKSEMLKVKEFAQQRGIRKGIEGYWVADEYDPWEMSALALHVLGYEGIYRCGPDGLFVVFINMHFV